MNNHIHKYRRIDIAKKKNKKYLVYKCTSCSHYLDPVLVVGRESICHRCESSFIMTEDSINVAEPYCNNCARSKNDIGGIVLGS